MDTDVAVDAQPAAADAASEATGPSVAPVASDCSKSEAGESTATSRGEKPVRIALFFGYLGTRFQGLQKNPGAFTVEDELERCLHKVGAISDADFGDLHKVGWNRAARTDKGVHAAAQVVSFRTVLPPGGEAELVRRLNAVLPPDMTCVDAIRTIMNFNSKNLCSSRQYEYLLPTFTLEAKPVGPAAPASGYIAPSRRAGKPMSEAAKRAAAAAEAEAAAAVAESSAGAGAGAGAGAMSVDADAAAAATAEGSADGASSSVAAAAAAPDAYQTGAAFAAGRAALAASQGAALAGALPPHFHRYTGDEGIAKAQPLPAWALAAPAGGDASSGSAGAGSGAGAGAASSSAAPAPASASASAVAAVPDDYQTGAAFARAAEQVRAAAAARAHLLRTYGYRMPRSAWTRLCGLAAAYQGGRAYHNFTPRMTFGDASTARFILEARISEPFIVSDEQAAALAAAQAAATASASSGAGAGAGASGDIDADAAAAAAAAAAALAPFTLAAQARPGVEYVKVTLVGQSFLYNQIRHMVGLLVDVMRGAAPAYMMERAFAAGVVKLPLAPAEGLYLSHCNFPVYDKRHAGVSDAPAPSSGPGSGPGSKRKQQQQQQQQQQREREQQRPVGLAAAAIADGDVSGGALRPLSAPLFAPGAASRLHRFKSSVIAAHIHSVVVKEKPFHIYMGGLESTPMSYRVHIPLQLMDVLSRKWSKQGRAARQALAAMPPAGAAAAPAGATAAAAPAAIAVDGASPASSSAEAAASTAAGAAAAGEPAVGEKRKREGDGEADAAPNAAEGDDSDDDDAAAAAGSRKARDDDGDDGEGDEGNADDDGADDGDGAGTAKRARTDNAEAGAGAGASSSSAAAPADGSASSSAGAGAGAGGAASAAANGAAAAAATAAAAARKTFRERLAEDDGRTLAFTLAHLEELLLQPAHLGLLGGANISKAAKEKSDFKRKLKEELAGLPLAARERRREEIRLEGKTFGTAASGGAGAGAAGEAGAEGASGDTAGAGAGAAGGAGRGGWRGSRGGAGGPAQTWRSSGRGRGSGGGYAWRGK